MVELLHQPGDSLGCQLSGHVPVEGAGSSSLLRVTQDVVPHCEVVSPLLCVQPVIRVSSCPVRSLISPLYEVNVVVTVGLLVHDQQPPVDVALVHLGDERVHVPGQLLDPELLLVDVSSVRPAGHPGHGGQVAAVAAHGLHYEDSPLGAGGRLPDPVADLGDRVQSRVGPDGEVGAGDVVGDGGGEDDHRDTELSELVSVFRQLQDCLKCLKTWRGI